MFIFTLGILASIFITMMAFSVKRKNILVLSVITGIVTTAQYSMLGEWGTVFLTTVSLFYALGLCFAEKFPQVESKTTAFVLMGVFSIGFFTVNGLSLSWSILSYIASLIGAFMLLFKNQLTLKWMMLVNGLAWGAFQIASGAYGQLPGELLFIVGVVLSLIVLTRAERRGEPLDSVPEMSVLIKSKIQSKNLARSGKIVAKQEIQDNRIPEKSLTL